MSEDYLAVPDGPGPWPGVVVIHDVGGLSEDIRRACRRLAAAGFLALAPNLFHRGERVRCVVGMARALQSGSGRAVDDIVAARHRLAADSRCTGRVGSVGFCTGGGFCLLLAPSGVFDATAPNYGNWPADAEALRHSCPVVASYGAKDRALRGDAAKLDTLLTDSGVPHDVKEYPDVGHSFMNDWRDAPLRLRVFESFSGFAFSAPEADDAWQRITAFFDAHLR
ncbi:MAG: dienelactone hydrolase family protein [Mycobacterium sp.]